MPRISLVDCHRKAGAVVSGAFCSFCWPVFSPDPLQRMPAINNTKKSKMAIIGLWGRDGMFICNLFLYSYSLQDKIFYCHEDTDCYAVY
jgi:hypothetical protein